MCEIYTDKIDVVSFFLEFGRKLTITVKFERNVKKWGTGSCLCWFFYLKLYMVLWKYFSSWVYIFVVWLKITSSWIRKFADFVFVPNKICWFYIFNIISFTAGFQNFEKTSIHSTNNPHNYVIGSGTWILMCSFSQLFFCIYQLRIGTK